jgi:hypothetical protein
MKVGLALWWMVLYIADHDFASMGTDWDALPSVDSGNTTGLPGLAASER